MSENIIIKSVINTIRNNPKVTLADFYKAVLEDPDYEKYRNEILSLRFCDFLCFEGATTKEDVIEAIFKVKDWLKNKQMKDIIKEINMPKDLVQQAVAYLRNDTEYPGKIMHQGEKKGMSYTWVDKQ